MRRFKLVILLIIVVLVSNINISYGRENKNSIQTTQIIIVKKDNLLAVIEDSSSLTVILTHTAAFSLLQTYLLS